MCSYHCTSLLTRRCNAIFPYKRSSSCLCLRCFVRATGEEFAAKRLSVRQQNRYPYLITNEMNGLIQTNACRVPRVVRYIELSALRTGEAFLILEWVQIRALGSSCMTSFSHANDFAVCFRLDVLCRLVRGTSLRNLQTNLCLPDVSAAPSIPQHEQEVMEIAAQLLQVGMQHLAELSESV